MVTTNRVPPRGGSSTAVPVGGRSGTNPKTKSISQDDLVQASKAIHDTLSKSLSPEIESLREEAKTLREEIKSLLASRHELKTELKDLVAFHLTEQLKSHEGHLTELHKVYKSTVPHLKSFDDKAEGLVSKALDKDFSVRMATVVKTYETQVQVMRDEHTKSLQTMQAQHQKALAEYSDRFDKSLQAMKDLVGSLPPPVIHLPESAIKVFVEQAKSEVSLSLKDLIIPAPVIHVESKSSPPVINVETKSPDVHVTVPPTPPRRKTFVYDDTGRPLEVNEQDVKE
jgi:hypothetical protein